MNASQQSQGSRVADAILNWVDLYTRALPTEVAQDRKDELRSDIYEQYAHAARAGMPLRSVDQAIALRAIRGVVADITWSTIHHTRRTRTMTTSAEVTPARQRLAGQLAAALWAILVVVAIIGLTGSITEMINTGGQVHGLVPWPGAANISLTIVVLIVSAATLALTAAIGLTRWLRARSTV
jgi:hypothetical protein